MSEENPQTNAAHALRDELEQLNQRKEDAFRRKQELSAKIAEKIKQVGDFKKSRNDLTRQVRELKVDRDKLNTQITEKINEIKATMPKPEPGKEAPAMPQLPTGPKGERLSPHEVLRQIRLLEQKIETIPMSFESEQKTMKQIKQMKKQLAAFEAVRGHSTESREKSKEIDTLKADANALHAKVTMLAKQSQEHHEQLITLSKEIEELKAAEEAAYQEFLGAKQEYMAKSGDVREAQDEVRANRAAERKQQDADRRKKEAEDAKTLKERAKEAEDKMMRGEKLNTEDLLALQSVRD
jgi:uncharacterized coiled-coil DUF342 family protein